MKPEYSVSIWEGLMYCKYCSQSRQLQWKDDVDEVVCDNLPARLQRKFQDELFFAADEHLVIDAVCVCVRRRRQDVSPTNVNNLLTASPFTFSHQFLLFLTQIRANISRGN